MPAPRPARPGSPRGTVARQADTGSAVVEFVVVVPLLLLVVLAVAQVSLALHVRATLASAAAEGARVAAVAGAGPDVGVRRTRAVLAGSLAADVVGEVTARDVTVGGLPSVEVEVHARLPLLGLLGPTALVVRGHAVDEE